MNVAAATSHRRLLLASSIVAFGAVFAAFVVFEVPGLGIAHFYYLPIALAAVAYGTPGGALAGAAAAGLYSVGIAVSPRIPMGEVMTVSTVIRFLTLTSLGILIGFVVSSNHRLVERLTELAERDFLTGLLNARAFDEALARRCEHGTPFVLVLADMDNLKEINDAHGHAEGNAAIRAVAEVLAAVSGPEDELARVGGDEFAVLTPKDAEGAKELCARVRERLRRDRLAFTFGWAASPGDGTDPVELFRKADDRLYAAKLVSRNRRAVAASAVAESSFSAS
jgi:diguanylate cyclase (GGDEF)-like protein